MAVAYPNVVSPAVVKVFESLLHIYKLTKEDCAKQVTDVHLEKISHSHCSCWESLAPYLSIGRNIVKAINRKGDEYEKKIEFFNTWKQEKGSDATYKAIIVALLEIKCRNDAEEVFKLLKCTPSLYQEAASMPSELVSGIYNSYCTTPTCMI